MHKLMEYICDEMDDLERKVEKEGKLSATEVQYLDMLAHTKKNLLKTDEMMEGEGEYSGYSRRGGSYARGRGRNAKRDRMGRYSSDGGYSMAAEDMAEELRSMAGEAPNDRIRAELQNMSRRIEQM